jgi:hypothetical protein
MRHSISKASSEAASTPRARTEEELLTAYEALIREAILDHVRCLGEDVCELTGARRIVREHPFASTAVAAGLGALAAGALARLAVHGAPPKPRSHRGRSELARAAAFAATSLVGLASAHLSRVQGSDPGVAARSDR